MGTQSEALAKTIKFCGVTRKYVAEKAGINAGYVTDILQGGANPTIAVIERALDGLEEARSGAKKYFYQLCAGDEPTIPPTPEEHVEKMSPQEAAAYMRAIASSFISSSGKKQHNTREITDEPLQLSLLTS